MRLHDSFNFHKKIKIITDTLSKAKLIVFRNQDEIIAELEKLVETQTEYTENLFYDFRPSLQAFAKVTDDEESAEILNFEVE